MQGRLSLRERLLVVMIAALLPLCAFSVWVALRETRAATELAQSQLKFAASLLAANQDRAVDAAEQLLGAIASLPELHAGGRARCQAYFQGLRDRYTMYTNIGLIATDGTVLCHAQGAAGDASAGDRGYFREAMSERRFVMGEPIVGRVTGRAAVPFALPVIEGGQVVAVAFAALDLSQAAMVLQDVKLPPHSRVLVADRHGHGLIEYPPQPGKAAIRTVTDAALLEAARTMKVTAGEAVDATGDLRIFALAPSRAVGTEGFVVRVGMSRHAVTHGAWARAREALAALGLMMLAAIAAVWWIGGHMIVKPAGQIVGAVRRLEKGKLDARVPIHGSSQRGEFARISAAFNLMAESLQLRQSDLEAELGRSRSAYAVLDQVLNSMQEGLVAVSAKGQFLLHNAAAARLFPLHDAPVLPQLWPEHFGFFEADGVTPYRADDLPLVRSALGQSGSQEHLFVRNALVPEGRLLQCSWQPIQGSGSLRGGLVVFTDVTQLQRLQAEQAAQYGQLQETQRKLIESQRIGRVGNWELDLGSGRLWWSDEVYALFGMTPADFDDTLQGFEKKVHPEDRPQLKPARDRALRDGELMSVEYRVNRPDGSVAWMHEIAEARRDEAGEPVWFGGVVQDITQRKRQEQALRDSERELQAYTLMLQRAAEAAQAMTSHASLDGTLREVVQQARHVLGTRHAALVLEGASPGEAPCTEGDLLTIPLVGRNGQRNGQLTLWGKEGGEFTQRDHYVAMEMAQLASIAIDNARLFTEIRELNASLESRIVERTAQLERQQQLYRTLAEQAPEVVWNTDRAGEVTYLNRAWYELVGGEPADWLGRGWFSRVHPEDRADVSRNWLESSGSLQAYSGTRRILARDGAYHTMSYKAAPIVDEDGQVTSWVGIDADITEFKAIEGALRSSNQELEAFSYSVSHDLRAPLGAIAGFSRALEGKVQAQADERTLHYVARIQAGVQKMEQLIESMLSLSKVVRAPLDWGEVDLSAIARETIEGLQMQHPDRRVAADVQDGLIAHGDTRLLRLVMENLLGNAWKFTSRAQAARIEVGRLGDTRAFFVRDNGVGFDMAYASKLFTAFQRLHTDSEFPGTGIGLATVRRVIARHQGRVWTESEIGRGTTFYFSLSDVAPPAWLGAGKG